MSQTFVPTDQAHRNRISGSLDETLFVEAGAGTGKTSALVERTVNLVASARATIDGVAAITFTEAAAAELRERVRLGLEEKGRSTSSTEEERQRCLREARRLERGSIQTIHSFAASLLRELPLEAGLPPDFDTVEEIEADLNFEDRWRRWLDEALEAEDIAPHLSNALRLGLKLDGLRKVAREFHNNYNLLLQTFAEARAPTLKAARGVVEAREEIRRLLRLAHDGADDPLGAHANRVADLGDRLAAMEPDTEKAALFLTRWGKLSSKEGNQKGWDVDRDTGENSCKLMKGLLHDLEGQRSQEEKEARRKAILPLLERLRRFVLTYAEERRNAGKAEFHDLLVWARNLLRDNPDAQAHFQRRFSHILIDELQDTDPIQAEIAFFLAGRPGTGAADWTRVKVTPGKLFMVGDSKQSIYRFRRADITALSRVRDLLGGAAVPLEQNFRCQEPIISWVNEIFGRWMSDDQGLTQAPYAALTARWSPPRATPPLGVHWFGGQRETSSHDIRQEEGANIAAVLRRIKSSAWKVRDGGDGGLRDARFQDVCVLIPNRTVLGALERALEDANIPYRIESQSMVLANQDVRELLDCMRAIDSPADQVALVAALRSSAFGCSDVELLRFVESGGSLDYINPGMANGPVRDALDTLRRFHESRTWEASDQLIERFIRERRMIEACFGRKRPRERWRRLRFVVQRARAFTQVGGGSLRAFLNWIERQAQEGARMVETPVPETDEDAVRIMTIHAAKGLEFPIVLLAGLGSASRGRIGPVIFDRATGEVEVSIGPNKAPFVTAGFEEASRREVAMEESEAVRLMYVAATRAKDHLIVSLFHGKRGEKSAAARIADLSSRRPELWHGILLGTGDVGEVVAESVGDESKVDTATDRMTWLQKRREDFARASIPASVAATKLAEIDKEEAERGEVSYRRGRAGTSLGRAVHSALQSIDLETGAGLEEISRAQAAAEGIGGRWRDVARLVRRGIETSVVKRAVASKQYYREVFVSTPVNGTLVEGFIDLLFESDGCLVVVDYKTDEVDGEEAAGRAKDRYRVQVGAYALAVEEATGLPVKEIVLAFLHAEREVPFKDLENLKTLARERVEAAARPLAS